MSEPTTFDALRVRKHLGRKQWGPPVPMGPSGFKMTAVDGQSSIIVTEAQTHPATRLHPSDASVWIHASIAHTSTMPSYDELVALKEAVWGDTGFAYQVFAAAADHVNLHEHALHLWGRADGEPVLPRFGRLGMI